MADVFNIAGRIHSTSQEEVVTTTNEILDAPQEKKQSEVNQEVSEELALHTNRLNALTGQNYVTVVATQSTTAADIPTLINASGEGEQADTLYRVGFWDGNAYVADKYTEYAWNGTAYVILDVKSSIGEVFDISLYKAVGGVLATFADLSAALGVDGANVPSSVRRGGMSIKFVQSSDNKYVQYRLMADGWSTTVNDWQGVDAVPTAGSKNLVESDGVYQATKKTDFIERDYDVESNNNIIIETDNGERIVEFNEDGIKGKDFLYEKDGQDISIIEKLGELEAQDTALQEKTDFITAGDSLQDGVSITDDNDEQIAGLMPDGTMLAKNFCNINGFAIDSFNIWKKKKVCIIGTSVAFGSESSYDNNPLDATKQGHAYCKEASKKLNFTPICAAVPGLAIHAYKIVYSDENNVEHTIFAPLSYGSTCLSKAEYAAWQNIRANILDGTYTIVLCSDPNYNSYASQAEWVTARTGSEYTIPSTPIQEWTPDSSYNSYYRTWENIFTADNADIDIFLFATVPNCTDFSNRDWDSFNKSTFEYNNQDDFAEHRDTFIGAMLFLMKKMYTMNMYARFVFVLDSGFGYTDGKADLETMATQWKIPIIDMYSKMLLTPIGLSVFKSHGGTNPHPSGYAQMLMGNILTNHLQLIS